MGEEAKKAGQGKEADAEEKPKPAEAKKDSGGRGEKGEAPPPPPPPPEEIVMRVYMHCDGCTKKVRNSLKGFEGVEEVTTDSRAHKVVVKGKKAAENPMKVVERVQKKTGRAVELLSPLPPPKPAEEEGKKEEEPLKPEEKEEPAVISVELKVYMHCEACAQEIKKRILKMKGVQAAEPDLKASQVTVKGVFDPPKLVEYIIKRTGKHATIVEAPEPAEKKAGGGGGDKAKDGGGKEGEKKAADGEKDEKKAGGGDEDAATTTVVDRMINQYNHHHYPRYDVGYTYPTPYPPQFFSDENPNACSSM